MTLVLAIVAGIVLALLVASVVAVLATAVLGAALAAVTVPYSLVKARLNRARVEPILEPSGLIELTEAEPVPVPVPVAVAVAVPVPAKRPASVWLRPAAVLAWAGVAVLMDLSGGQRGR